MLGQTRLGVSRIGLGLAALGRPGYINLGHAADLGSDRSVDAMERHAHRVLDAAWAAGFRYFDAARSYGQAEAFLASWLAARGIGPEELTVGSKWGYVYTAGWHADAEVHEVKDHSVENLRRQLAESRAILGAHLKLYQLHSATLDTGVLEDTQVLRALAGARADGLSIGLSTSGPRQADTIRRALDVEVDGTPLFSCVQATWNLLEPSAGAALTEAHAAGWGVIVKEALANGRLTERAAHDDVRAQQLVRLAQTFEVSPDALALAAVLRQPWADVVLSGASTVEQLESNVRALSVSAPEDVWVELGALAGSPDAYWNRRKQLAWT